MDWKWSKIACVMVGSDDSRIIPKGDQHILLYSKHFIVPSVSLGSASDLVYPGVGMVERFQ